MKRDDLTALADRLSGSLGPFSFVSRAERDMVLYALRTLAARQAEPVAWGAPHVEYSASRGQSKVTYWVSREDGERILCAAPPATDAVREVLPKRPDSAYTSFHLQNWTDYDFAKHVTATRTTLQYLIELERAVAQRGGTSYDGGVEGHAGLAHGGTARDAPTLTTGCMTSSAQVDAAGIKPGPSEALPIVGDEGGGP